MYLTVKEAIEESNKSQTTIHRLCQKYENTKHVKKEGNKYLIDRAFLQEKYPSELNTSTVAENISNNLSDDGLLKTLTEKNNQITDLTVKLKKLEEETIENNQELAETIDANISLNKELEAVSTDKFDFSTTNETPSELKAMLYKALTITGSVALLIVFIFMMYYFTK